MSLDVEQLDLSPVDAILARLGGEVAATVGILQAIQEHYGYLPGAALEHVCRRTSIAAAEIEGVASFYSHFRRRPVGRHLISVCNGTACHVRGAEAVYDAFAKQLSLTGEADTSADGLYTLRRVACLGCCTLAPAVQIDEVTFGHLTPTSAGRVLTDFQALRTSRGEARGAGILPACPEGVSPSPDGEEDCLSSGDKAHGAHNAGGTPAPRRTGEILLGLGSCCQARGSAAVMEALERVLSRWRLEARVRNVGCVGMCHQTPLLEIVEPDGRSSLYAQVQPGDVESVVLRHFRPVGAGRRLARAVAAGLDFLWGDPGEAVAAMALDAGPAAEYLGPQRHVATEHCGQLDPLDLAQYRQMGGWDALERARAMTGEAVIAAIRESGLRGRGGAGFPTWRKWQSVRDAVCGSNRSTGVPPVSRMGVSPMPSLPNDQTFISQLNANDTSPPRDKHGQDARATHGRDAHATVERAYVICNGDEGDPGAFMDRMLLESYPFRVLEGMAIAAHAVGARELIFYIRAEYPLAVRRVTAAIEAARDAGLLGGRDGGDALRVEVRLGAGAFVCGEETALIASLEGQRGMPRLRPPFPATRGLHGRPTLVNNVETFATVPWILRHGGAALAEMGTETSRGTKVFALAGKVARGGLIEVPMGVTLRQIVQDIGGGVGTSACACASRDAGILPAPDGEDDVVSSSDKPHGAHNADETPASRCGRDARVTMEASARATFKAVQIGGPSGGCLPAALADTPVDYQALISAGAIMGSGGLVVLDEADCMVEIARYFIEFTQDQSCGRCTFCRVGTRRMLDILTALCEGKAAAGDVDELERLAKLIRQGSLCGLGKTAPNPVLSTLRYFRHEYDAHVQGHCPAGQCKALVRYVVGPSCIGCTRCAQHCPVDAVAMRPYRRHDVDDALCTRCGICRTVCPTGAMSTEKRQPLATSH